MSAESARKELAAQPAGVVKDPFLTHARKDLEQGMFPEAGEVTVHFADGRVETRPPLPAHEKFSSGNTLKNRGQSYDAELAKRPKKQNEEQ